MRKQDKMSTSMVTFILDCYNYHHLTAFIVVFNRGMCRFCNMTLNLYIFLYLNTSYYDIWHMIMIIIIKRKFER